MMKDIFLQKKGQSALIRNLVIIIAFAFLLLILLLILPKLQNALRLG